MIKNPEINAQIMSRICKPVINVKVRNFLLQWLTIYTIAKATIMKLNAMPNIKLIMKGKNTVIIDEFF